MECPPCLHEAGSEVYLKQGKKENKGKIGIEFKKERKKERERISKRKENTFVLKTRPVSMRRVGRLSFPKETHFSENFQTTKNFLQISKVLIFQEKKIYSEWMGSNT